MIDAVLRSIEAGEATALAQRLVRIPSVVNREGAAISEAVAAWFRVAGIPVVLDEISPGRVNVCATVAGRADGPTLLLNGHMDTKPFDGMTIDPIGGVIDGGRLWGRGAADMKSAIAAMMIAARAIHRAGGPERGTLKVGCEVGEEGGNWTFNQLIDGPGACDALICGEPTRLDVHLGSRGFFPMSVRTTGRATHTGMAYEGINAVEKMATVITALYALPCFHEVDPIWGRVPINAETISGGGLVTASLPESCEVKFDIRLNPGLTAEALENAVNAELTRLRAEDADLQVAWWLRSRSAAPAWIDDGHPLLAAARAAVEAVMGTPTRIGGFPGGCSAGIANRRGIPGLVLGPGSLGQAHTVDEWIEVDQIEAAAPIYARVALDFLG